MAKAVKHKVGDRVSVTEYDPELDEDVTSLGTVRDAWSSYDGSTSRVQVLYDGEAEYAAWISTDRVTPLVAS
jgi:metal-sulfur cluster biosynthetic enzyme